MCLVLLDDGEGIAQACDSVLHMATMASNTVAIGWKSRISFLRECLTLHPSG